MLFTVLVVTDDSDITTSTHHPHQTHDSSPNPTSPTLFIQQHNVKHPFALSTDNTVFGPNDSTASPATTTTKESTSDEFGCHPIGSADHRLPIFFLLAQCHGESKVSHLWGGGRERERERNQPLKPD
jgi:hypothetical protein